MKKKYIIFGNKDDWYHMVCLMDNTFYDKNERYQELNIIKIYKLKPKHTNFKFNM